MIFLKSCVEHRTVRMCSHYTSGIDSYEALQKRSFKKPWYCLNVQSHVSYFANIIMCCFPVRIHRGVTFVRVANSTLPSSNFLFFLASSFPSQLLALPLSHSLSFLVSLSIVVSLVVLVDCCLLVVCDCPLLMNLVSVRYYRIVCTYSTGCMVR